MYACSPVCVRTLNSLTGAVQGEEFARARFSNLGARAQESGGGRGGRRRGRDGKCGGVEGGGGGGVLLVTCCHRAGPFQPGIVGSAELAQEVNFDREVTSTSLPVVRRVCPPAAHAKTKAYTNLAARQGPPDLNGGIGVSPATTREAKGALAKAFIAGLLPPFATSAILLGARGVCGGGLDKGSDGLRSIRISKRRGISNRRGKTVEMRGDLGKSIGDLRQIDLN